MKGGFSYSGQRCTAVKLVIVHEAVADAVARPRSPHGPPNYLHAHSSYATWLQRRLLLPLPPPPLLPLPPPPLLPLPLPPRRYCMQLLRRLPRCLRWPVVDERMRGWTQVEGVNAGIALLRVGQPEDDADITAVVSKSSADFIEARRQLLCAAWHYMR